MMWKRFATALTAGAMLSACATVDVTDASARATFDEVSAWFSAVIPIRTSPPASANSPSQG